MKYLSEVVDDLLVSSDFVEPSQRDRSVIKVCKFKSKYFLISGIDLVHDYLRDAIWDYQIKVVNSEPIPTPLNCKHVKNLPHAKTDKTQDKKQRYTN